MLQNFSPMNTKQFFFEIKSYPPVVVGGIQLKQTKDTESRQGLKIENYRKLGQARLKT